MIMSGGACKDLCTVEPKSPPHYYLMTNLVVRGLGIVLSGVSIALLVTNTQTVSIFSIQFQPHYYYSSAFRFLLGAEAIVCAFSLLTFILILLLKRQTISHLTSRHYFCLFLHDTVMTVLMISGCAGATAIGYVGEYGEWHMGWDAICGRVPKFCRTNMVSISLAYFAFFAYFGLSLLTPYSNLLNVSSSSSIPHI